MPFNLTDAIFTDKGKAPEHFEAIRWPHGPVWPYSGAASEPIAQLAGKMHRPGLYQCNACIRGAMRPTDDGQLGSEGKTVEADKTHVGGKAKNRAYAKTLPRHEVVMSLLERSGLLHRVDAPFPRGCTRRIPCSLFQRRQIHDVSRVQFPGSVSPSVINPDIAVPDINENGKRAIKQPHFESELDVLLSILKSKLATATNPRIYRVLYAINQS